MCQRAQHCCGLHPFAALAHSCRGLQILAKRASIRLSRTVYMLLFHFIQKEDLFALMAICNQYLAFHVTAAAQPARAVRPPDALLLRESAEGLRVNSEPVATGYLRGGLEDLLVGRALAARLEVCPCVMPTFGQGPVAAASFTKVATAQLTLCLQRCEVELSFMTNERPTCFPPSAARFGNVTWKGSVCGVMAQQAPGLQAVPTVKGVRDGSTEGAQAGPAGTGAAADGAQAPADAAGAEADGAGDADDAAPMDTDAAAGGTNQDAAVRALCLTAKCCKQPGREAAACALNTIKLDAAC